MSRLARTITKHPLKILALIAGLTVVAACFAARVTIDSSAESLIPADSPEARFYDDARKTFGNEGLDAVILLADDVYRSETLAKIARLDAKLSAISGVERVQSLASIDVVTPTADGGVEFGPAMAEMPKDAAGIARLQKLVAEHPLLRGTFVSGDGKAAMLLLDYRKMPVSEFVASGIFERVEQVLAAERGPEELHVVGVPATYATSARMMWRDLARFVPLTSLVIIAVLFASFRSLRGVLVPLVTVGVGIVWTVGLMGFTGARIDFLGLVLPSLLLAIGIAYATHVVAGSYEELDNGGNAREIVTRVLERVGPPVFVTAFTTLVGFAGLVVYRIPAIRSFGIYATFGIAVLFLLSLTLTAALLAVLPLPRRNVHAARGEWPLLRRMLDSIVAFDLRRRRELLVAAIALSAFFAWGIPRIELDSNYTSYFPARSPLRVAAEIVDRHFGGSVNFLVVVDGGEEGALTRIDPLQRLDGLAEFVARMPGVGGVSSLADVVRIVHRALRPEDPPEIDLPATDSALRQYLLLLPPEATDPFVTPDGSRAAIRVRSSLRGSKELGATLQRIEEFGRAVFPRGVRVQATGVIPVVDASAERLTTGQVQSVLLATGVVFAVLSIFFVSLRLGLIAMIPNLVPIVIYFGVLGWAGIPLGISTAIIASLVLGLGVDEAIHLLSEFDSRVRRHGDQERAIHEAMGSVGPPVVFATTSLSLGFLVQAFSGFVPIQQFAWLTALNIFTSLLADLFILPAFVASVRVVSIWDLVRLKLGRAPERTIPFLHGLRRSQARVALLMGQLRTLRVGEPIVLQGDPGDSMFVLLSGRAEVRIWRESGSHVVGIEERGAVIGEMGLLRREARSADVVALEPCEVLRIDEHYFDALLRRSPRIAGKLLVNLSRNLSDRVQSLSETLVDSTARSGARRAT